MLTQETGIALSRAMAMAADTVAGLDRRPAIANDALGYLALLRPQVFADALVHPTNRVSQVVVWLWVAEISQRR
jgi:hypothetical protein